MAQFYTLEEAASRLSIGVDDFKRRLKTEWTSIRPFRDGATLRFRAADIDELARSLGAASDPLITFEPDSTDDFELSLTDEPPSSQSSARKRSASEDIFAPSPGDSGIGKSSSSSSSIRKAGDSKAQSKSGVLRAQQTRRAAEEAEQDVFSFAPPGESGSGIGKSKPKAADSNVNISPPNLDDSDESSLQIDEVDINIAGPGSAVIKPSSASKASAPKSGTKLGASDSSASKSKIPSPKGMTSDRDSSSEFELTLDSDSDSFELNLNAGSSEEEIDLGGEQFPIEKPDQQSGIDLGKPADSGIDLGTSRSSNILEGKGGLSSRNYSSPKMPPSSTSSPRIPQPGSSSLRLGSTSAAKLPPAASASSSSSKLPPPASDEMDIDFELALDPDAAPATGRNSARPLRHMEPKSRSMGSPEAEHIQDSEFELSLDEHSGITEQVAEALKADERRSKSRGGNIFETDFELPAVDADAEMQPSGRHRDIDGTEPAPQYEEDFVEDHGSASQVMLVDDSVLDADALEVRAAYDAEHSGEEDLDGAAVVDMDIVTDDITSSRAMRELEPARFEERVVTKTIVQAPPKWGSLPAIMLCLSFVPVFLGALMSFEVMRGMWGYHQPSKPGGMIVRGVADTLGMKAAE